MRYQITTTIRILLVLAVGGCAPKMAIDYDKAADFTRYRTYAWNPGTPLKNPLMDRRIVTAIDDQLANKAFRKTETNPDILISYHAALSEEVHYYTTSHGVGHGPSWGRGYGRYGRWGGWGASSWMSKTTPTTLTIGTLNVDLYDAKDKQMIWRGSASETISDDPEKNSEAIREVIATMFEKFPPK